MRWWWAGAILAAGRVAFAVPETPKPPNKPQTTAPAPQPPANGKENEKARDDGLSFGANQITGQVQSFDPAEKKIVIDQSGERHDLQVTDDTTVFVDGRLGSIADLKAGERVRAAFENETGSHNLRWIEVAPAEATKSYTGHITAIDREHKKLTVSHGDSQKVLEFSDSTQVVGQGGPASLGDLREGQEVRASYQGTKTLSASKFEVVVTPDEKKEKAPTKTDDDKKEPAPAPKSGTQPPETTY